MSIQVRFGQFVHDPLAEPLTESECPFILGRHLVSGNLTCTSKPNNQRYWKSSRTHSPFVSATIYLRFQPNPWVFLANVEGTHSLGSVYLVRGNAEQINPHVIDVEGDLPNRLNSICVEQNAFFFAQLADALDRLERTD